VISALPTEVAITGIGVVSPIGTGREEFWSALLAGRSGVRPIRQFDAVGIPVRFAAEIEDFDPLDFISKRKSLKLMSRDAQLGLAAASLACRDAGLREGAIDPQRFGVVLGADRNSIDLTECQPAYQGCLVQQQFDFSRWGNAGMAASYPLLFLKALPNMIASHVAIAQDARGPNNTIHQTDVSALLALGEALRTIERGAADAMIVGAASAQLNPHDYVRRCVMGIHSLRQDDPTKIMRPFDADRNGQVWGEGAAAFILERRSHAEARGATILARVLSCANAAGGKTAADDSQSGALPRAMTLAIARAGLTERGVGHVNAHGLSAVRDDPVEARALADVVPDAPVFAPKSYFGNLGAASGAVEMAASVLALHAGLVPATLNYERPDPACPVRNIRREAFAPASSTSLLVNWTWIGQAAAAVLAGPE
jgi:3-oxoacyl-[acyl-carrier-protein] synthase II